MAGLHRGCPINTDGIEDAKIGHEKGVVVRDRIQEYSEWLVVPSNSVHAGNLDMHRDSLPDKSFFFPWINTKVSQIFIRLGLCPPGSGSIHGRWKHNCSSCTVS